jgi:hypothetical protein
MSNVIPFKRPTAAHKHNGNTLCRRGFHKWVVEQPLRCQTGPAGDLLSLPTLRGREN